MDWIRLTQYKYYILRVSVCSPVLIQHAKRMRCIVICDLSDSTIFLHVIS